MKTKLLKGNLDLVLLSILEDAPKYGLEIISEARSRTDGYFKFGEGSLYPALHRLEKNKFIRADYQPSDTGGPPRKYYHLTPKGEKHLAQEREDYTTFHKAIKTLWGSK